MTSVGCTRILLIICCQYPANGLSSTSRVSSLQSCDSHDGRLIMRFRRTTQISQVRNVMSIILTTYRVQQPRLCQLSRQRLQTASIRHDHSQIRQLADPWWNDQDRILGDIQFLECVTSCE